MKTKNQLRGGCRALKHWDKEYRDDEEVAVLCTCRSFDCHINRSDRDCAQTLVQPVEPALPTRSAPLVTQPQTQSEQTSVWCATDSGGGGAAYRAGSVCVSLSANYDGP